MSLINQLLKSLDKDIIPPTERIPLESYVDKYKGSPGPNYCKRDYGFLYYRLS